MVKKIRRFLPTLESRQTAIFKDIKKMADIAVDISPESLNTNFQPNWLIGVLGKSKTPRSCGRRVKISI